MGRIQSSIGLITGVPIGETVDQLMALSAKPRDLLQARTKVLETEQTAVTELTALLASVQYVAKSLGKASLYQTRSAATSDPTALSATVTGNPAIGLYQFAPLRLAQSEQWLSSGVRDRNEPLDAGSLAFRFGPGVDREAPLETLNGAAGFVRGKIRITDRSGASAEIDLSAAVSLGDVLDAINANGSIRVTASAVGDSLRLVDGTGAAVSNLRVEEVGGGTTAASLGLAAIDVAAASADGDDLLRLDARLRLDALNDGNGVAIHRSLADIGFTLRDGTTGQIDLSPLVSGSSQVDADLTLGDVLERINAAAPGKLRVEIAAGGDRLQATDLTAGGGEFSLAALSGSAALADLGLDRAPSGGVIAGRRLMAGLGDVLLASLDGGKGLDLGVVQLTDRSGATANVDLAGAETLGEIVDRINIAPVALEARVNRAGHGIEIVDSSGGSGNLVVANGDAKNSADKLGVAISAAVDAVSGGDLHLQVVAENTLLSAFGEGVAKGSFTLVDSLGVQAVIDLDDDDVQTLGDVLRKINQTALQVQAEINATGDGIAIRDTGEGPGTLRAIEGSSTTAADLRLLGTAVASEEQGIATQTLDGSTTFTVAWEDGETLDDVVERIAALDAGVTAAVLADGSSLPYRLSLVSGRSGRAGRLVLDVATSGFDVQKISRGEDALLALGSGQGVVIASSSNTFSSLVEGLRLEAKQATGQPVRVNVAVSDANLVAAVKTLVDNYNKFRSRLDELTAYDALTDQRAVLAGDATALRLDADLSHLLSGRFYGSNVRSLGEIGISFQEDGSLALDEAKLKERYAADAEGVEKFFTADDDFAARLDSLLEQVAGVDQSALSTRLEALSRKVQQNTQRLEAMNLRLDRQREALLEDFYRMELAIGKLQNNMNALAAIQALEPVSSSQE